MEDFDKNENATGENNEISLNDAAELSSKDTCEDPNPVENTVSSENYENNEKENIYTAQSEFSQPVDNAGNSPEHDDSYRTPNFYTESYKKPSGRKHNSLLQLIIVAVVSSILGGAIVGGILVFVPSAVQPAVQGYFGKVVPGTPALDQNSSGIVKKVEIEKSDSPVTAIAEKVSPSIVGIRVTAAKVQDFFGLDSQQGPAEGSGIIIKSDGYIMTNNHVISGALDSTTGQEVKGAKIEVILPSQKDKPYTAHVVGKDQKTDLAVLKIDTTGLPAAELGNSDDLKVGELAVAIGNPGGMEFMGSVTVGVISGLNRTIEAEDNTELKLIQTDASINPGNSGGALVNSKGQVIGVNSAKIVAQGFEGLGFAIPINKAKEITDNLMQYKYVRGRPGLGVTIDMRFTEEVAKQYNVPAGLLVQDVAPLSGAYKAGIQRNDIITKFDGKAVKTFNELETQKNKHKPGDTVEVEIYRDNKYVKVKVTLTEMKN